MTLSFSATVMSFLALLGFAGAENARYQGYVEGDYVLVAPQFAGMLDSLAVKRGQTITQGETLFTQEHAAEDSAVEQAKASVDRAEAALRLASLTYERDVKQLTAKAVSAAVVDADRAAVDQAKAQLAEARAALVQAEWKLDQKRRVAPSSAFVFDTLYREGEFVPAGQPVVSLLPPSNIKVRFFVPEGKLAKIQSGMPVQIMVGGEKESRTARVTYISPKAEYTPPQLYNRENRERMLFMIEALPDASPETLHPGQPVDVSVGAP